MATRTQARTAVVQMLYALDLGNEDMTKQSIEYLDERKIKGAKGEFANSLFQGVLEHLSEIDEVIKNITTSHLNRELLTSFNKNKLYYATKQADNNIKVVLPFIFKRDDLLNLNKKGLEGSTARIIECIKEKIRKKKFSELSGNLGKRYIALYEPITVVNSDLNIGSDLWRADRYNYINNNEIHLLLRMIFRDRTPKIMAKRIDELTYELNDFIQKIPYKILEKENTSTVNQKDLRNRLKELGLVSFVGDNSKPAREYTKVRRHYRIAGPKKGINIPFETP